GCAAAGEPRADRAAELLRRDQQGADRRPFFERQRDQHGDRPVPVPEQRALPGPGGGAGDLCPIHRGHDVLPGWPAARPDGEPAGEHVVLDELRHEPGADPAHLPHQVGGGVPGRGSAGPPAPGTCRRPPRDREAGAAAWLSQMMRRSASAGMSYAEVLVVVALTGALLLTALPSLILPNQVPVAS